MIRLKIDAMCGRWTTIGCAGLIVVASLSGCAGIEERRAQRELDALIALAGAGDADANYRLAEMYDTGTGVEPDPERAFESYRLAADAGHEPAYRPLAEHYFDGRGTAQDFSKALAAFSLAADSGDTEARLKLAQMYQFGVGTNADLSKAMVLYRQAAIEGDPIAQYSFGSLIKDQKIATGPEEDRAIDWFLKSASQGNAKAQLALGDIYRLGDGISVDLPTSRYWYALAADQDDRWAQAHLGDLLSLRADSESRDLERAVTLYSRSAELGVVHSQTRLGEMYIDGLGTEQNLRRALELFERAAAKGHAPAQCNLGNLYYRGLGVAQDFDTATYWFDLASGQSPKGVVSLLGLMRSDCQKLL